MEERYSKDLIIDCLDKLDNLNDYTWEDILDKYGLEISTSHVRKMAYGFRAYRNSFGGENDSEFKEKMLKIKTEKVKLSDLRCETNRQVRNLARIENIVDLLKDNIDNLSEEKPMINQLLLHKNSTSGNDGIIILSDLHIGIEVNNSVNEYNIDIAKERLNKIVYKTIENGKRHNIDKLFVVLNGDLLSGELHSSIKLSNAETLTSQIVLVSEIISEVIKKLSDNFFVSVIQNNGNHEAVELIKDDRNNKNNYSMLINEMIKLRTRDLANVMFLDSINNGEMTVFRVKNLNVVATHGDQIKLNNCAEQLTMAVGFRPQLVLLGHYHKPMMLSQLNTDIYVNGSLVSTDDYAFKLKLYNPPSQTMLIVNDEGVDASYILRV
ncbi:metallophosphoesterase [Peptostreptococcus porci]|uniref:metallophosphoesterase n=1 Tax=Peptostreptococcus porci TaxID=2652282 RepID=UPI002A80F9C8|nr:metallophosphoesterase [Peptostreptococcus porci]MDY4127627.1 hypothetical protein [Peptostreptococcus porci]